jgi:hypothetical protein
MEQDIIKNTEIVEDMPDFEEITAEMPCEGEESVTETTDETENAIVSEEKPQGDTEEKKPKELNPYEKVILAEMERRAQNGDELLATAMQSNDKNIQSCYEYVKAQARKQAVAGCAMIEDAVVYGWAHHYYIESKETIDKEMKKSDPKTEKKTAEKPKPVKNVLDITKAIVSATKGDTGKKREKKKDSLKAGFVPMERPDTIKDAKKGSREQAKSVEQMDLFAAFFAE